MSVPRNKEKPDDNPDYYGRVITKTLIPHKCMSVFLSFKRFWEEM